MQTVLPYVVEMMQSSAPFEISDHHLVCPIAKGGFGEVWLAKNATGVYRAVKILKRGRFSDDRPYELEFKGVQSFEPISREHTGLMDVLHVARNDKAGFFYCILELADNVANADCAGSSGSTLIQAQNSTESYIPKTLEWLMALENVADAEKSRRFSALNATTIIEIMRSLCSALAHLHKHNLVHRDIKPANIIFVQGVAKLADIGLVTTAESSSSRLGTPSYLAPEGSGGKQADIFSAGKILYEMVTGLQSKHWALPAGFEDAPEELRQLNKIAMTACSGEADRYKTIEEMLCDLDAITNKRLRAAEETVRRQQRVVHRQRWVMAFFFTGVLVLLALARFSIVQKQATEGRRRTLLKQLEVERLGLRSDGWFKKFSNFLNQLPKVPNDEEARAQASSFLAGMDASQIVSFKRSAQFAAFNHEGAVLVGGADKTPSLLLSREGIATWGSGSESGPVGWRADGTPFQLVPKSDCLALQNPISGQTIQKLQIPLGTRMRKQQILALSADGKFAAASIDAKVLLWDVETGEIRSETFAPATALAFSPDNNSLGAGDALGITRILSVPALEEQCVLPAPERGNAIRCVAFGRNPVKRFATNSVTNSWLIATGDQGATIVIWDLAKKIPRILKGSTYYVTAVAFSPDGCTLASAGRNQPLVWDLATGKRILQLSQTSSGSSLALAFDETGSRLLTGGIAEGGNPNVTLWRLEPDRGIKALRGLGSSPIRKVWVSPKNDRVAALSDDWQLGFWKIGNGWLDYVFEAPMGNLAENAGGSFSSDGESFAFASMTETCVYDLSGGAVAKRWDLPAGFANDTQFDQNGQLILIRTEWASKEELGWKAYVLSDDGPKLLGAQQEHQETTEMLALSPTADWFLAGSFRGTNSIIRALNLSGNEFWKTTINQKLLHRFSIDSTGKLFGFAKLNRNGGGLRICEFPSFRDEGSGDDYEMVGPGGQSFAGSIGGACWLFLDLAGRSHGVPLSTDWHALHSVSAFGRDGNYLAWGTEEGIVLVANIRKIAGGYPHRTK